jgi:hypothetical protein
MPLRFLPAVMGCLRCLSVMASDLDNEQAPQLVQVRLRACGQIIYYTQQLIFSNELVVYALRLRLR